MITIEVCVGSVASALAAERGGAHRVELCAALVEGGTTPSWGMVREVVGRVSLPVVPIIRPRGGDFLYTKSEVRVMLEDIKALRKLGVAGFSLGALTKEGRLDREINSQLIAACGHLPVTLHRAFDRTGCLEEELEVAIDLGFSRVLTSGGATKAPDAVAQLAQLVALAGDRITIMAGAGVRAENAAALIRQSGVSEIHGTFSAISESGMQYLSPHFPTKYREEVGEFFHKESDEQSIRRLVENIKDL